MNEHFVSTGIYAEGCTRADWYAGHGFTLRALRRGIGASNLFGSDPERVLREELDDVRAAVGV